MRISLAFNMHSSQVRFIMPASKQLLSHLASLPSFFFKQKPAYEVHRWLEFRRVLFRSDSNGGGGLITNGDTQWMTAGGGILHIEEPPEELVVSGGLFHGFQLWVNLPARLKMTSPRYQD